MPSFVQTDLVQQADTQPRRATRVGFLFSHGFAARMVLRSGVASRLIAEGIEVTVISPNANEEYFKQECQTDGISLKQDPHSGDGRIAQWFRAYRPYFLDDVTNNVAHKTRHARELQNRYVFGSALKLINRTIARWSAFRTFARTVECRINKSDKIRAILSELRPDLLVLSNPFGVGETVYLLYARELGIPVACQMLSWDNITSKGTPLLMPQYFISWGPIMTEEMIDLYSFPRERIFECGVSHFDVYSQKDQFTGRNILLKQLGLPPELPYIFYGMVPSYSCPNELDTLSWLTEQVNKNSFARRCSLVIRPHPQSISGIYARSPSELAKLQSLAGPRVGLDMPPVLSERLAWDLPKSDMYHLGSLLFGSEMCINANSTLCLDACVLERPVINVAFDGWEEVPYEWSARRGPDYIHMAKLLAFGGIRIARSFDELKRHINAYLCDSRLDHEQRMVSAAQECGPCDGRAAERVATTLLGLALQNG